MTTDDLDGVLALLAPLTRIRTADRSDPVATAQLLDRAVDLIDVRGWCQGAYIDAQDRLCLGGALLTADEAPFRRCRCGGRHPDIRRPHIRHIGADAAMCAVHRQLLRDGYLGGPVAFNDAPGRTHGEVTDLLRRTAKRLREQTTAAA